MKTSLAVVTPSFHPMVGGVELYVLGIGRELASMGYDVHVYTADSVMGRRMPREEEVLGLHVHRVHIPFELSYRLKVWQGLKHLLADGGHDLVHVYSQDSYAIPASQAAVTVGVPLALTTYGPFKIHSEYGAAEALALQAYDSIVTPVLFRRCSSVLVRYPELEGWVVSHGLAKERVSLEPSGIPREFLGEFDGEGIREELGGEKLLLYLGRISPQKGVQHALLAMQRVKRRYPKAKLVMVGPDYTGFGHELLRSAERLGISENVRIQGAVDANQEGRLLAACDAFVMPSSFEGFSQAVMKAMAQSKPVVVTSVGGLPYEVGYGECGVLCKFGEPALFADGIISVLESGELSERLGRNAKNRAAQFTFDILARRLSHHYSSLLSN